MADDLGLTYSLVKRARWAASRWPKERRQSGVSFTVHEVLASVTDEAERFEVILAPPRPRGRWTPDEAKRRVRRQVERPVSPEEKVRAIHTLAASEEVSAKVTGGLLRQPGVMANVEPKNKVRAVEELTRDNRLADDREPQECRYVMRFWWQLVVSYTEVSMDELALNVGGSKLEAIEELIGAIRSSHDAIDAWIAATQQAFPVVQDRGWTASESDG
ncbi:DUF6192 family protein [Kitasatospora purpeofusca]|uniref:DUF6192 family protein n=1 Tax=Kitasatospora purpeofusca TaxID=67352 RepID=UPI00068B0726|nr:DUF6192 family protein [Kitasatospora purpeofusca]